MFALDKAGSDIFNFCVICIIYILYFTLIKFKIHYLRKFIIIPACPMNCQIFFSVLLIITVEFKNQQLLHNSSIDCERRICNIWLRVHTFYTRISSVGFWRILSTSMNDLHVIATQTNWNNVGTKLFFVFFFVIFLLNAFIYWKKSWLIFFFKQSPWWFSYWHMRS